MAVGGVEGWPESCFTYNEVERIVRPCTIQSRRKQWHKAGTRCEVRQM